MPWAQGTARWVRSVVVLGCVLCVCVPAQNSAAEYDDKDAYEIYSLLLPDEEAYRLANGTLVIQQETVNSETPDYFCLEPQVASEFKGAMEDYKRHEEAMLLQRRFEIDKPYELVNTETIRTLIKRDNWDDFYTWYPDSGGIIRMSAVGFNRQRTLAIVYTWSTRDNIGSGSVSLLKKIKGKWKLVTRGRRCIFRVD